MCGLAWCGEAKGMATAIEVRHRHEGAHVVETSTRNYPRGDLRASDADRDRAVSELSEAFQAGRITAGEFGQRSGQALTARTGKELTDLLTDLPKDNGTPAGRLARSPRTAGTLTALGASGAAAASLAFLTLVNALTAGTNPGLTLAGREARRTIAEQVLKREGLPVSVPLPPSGAYGTDWAGIATPAVITVVLIGLTIILWRAARIRSAAPAHRGSVHCGTPAILVTAIDAARPDYRGAGAG
jgi:hypothetical protein